VSTKQEMSSQPEICQLSSLLMPSLQAHTAVAVPQPRLAAHRYRDEPGCNAVAEWNVEGHTPLLQLPISAANISGWIQCQMSQHCSHADRDIPRHDDKIDEQQ